MAFLIVGGQTVDVSVDGGASRTRNYIGGGEDSSGAVETFDGSMKVGRLTTKDTFRFKTVLMTRTAANALEALIDTVPVTCSGDALGGSGSYIGMVTGWSAAAVPGDHRVALEFTLRQV